MTINPKEIRQRIAGERLQMAQRERQLRRMEALLAERERRAALNRSIAVIPAQPELSPRAQEALDAHVEACAAQGLDPLEARAEALAAVQGMRAILDRIPTPTHYPTLPQSTLDVFFGGRRS